MFIEHHKHAKLEKAYRQLKIYKSKNKPTRSELRFNRILKAALKSSNYVRYQIQKQRIFIAGNSGFIADFYLPDIDLVIEIDGPYHREKKQIKYDKNRDNYFSKRGIKVIRYTNEQTYQKQRPKLLKHLTKTIIERTKEITLRRETYEEEKLTKKEQSEKIKDMTRKWLKDGNKIKVYKLRKKRK